jgi:hypothetical protein
MRSHLRSIVDAFMDNPSRKVLVVEDVPMIAFLLEG